MKPLYIWAGGKSKMIPKYQKAPGLSVEHCDTYVEPFFGGGAMMCWMKQHQPTIKRWVLNDVKSELTDIYEAIKTDVDAFILRVDELQSLYLPHETKESRKQFYYEVRDSYIEDWQAWDKTYCSATLYFMMKTCFNGIWQTTKKSQGRFATPAGLMNQTSTVYDKQLVLQWNEFLQECEIHCGDWKQCSDQYLTGNSFFFMDPPYRGSFTSYGEEFDDELQTELLAFCQQADAEGNLIFLCNRDTGDDFWTRQLGDLALCEYDVTYTAGRRKKNDDGSHSAKPAREVLLYSASIDNC